MSKHHPENNSVVFSFRKGLYVPFFYKGHQIVVHNASFTPREKIWVDDELRVNRWSLSMDSTQVIEVSGEQLILTYGWTKGMASYFLTVKNGNETVYEMTYPFNDNNESSKLSIVVSLLIGGLAGYFGIQLLLGLF